MVRYMLKLAFGQIRYEKKRSFSVFLVLALATFLILQVFFLFHAYCEMKIQDARENGGEFYVHIKDLGKSKEKVLENDNHIKIAGCVSRERNAKVNDTDISVAGKKGNYQWYTMDEKGFQLSGIRLLYGRFPNREGEIIVSSGMKRGDSFLYQGLSGKKASDLIEVKLGDSVNEYRIVGIVDDMNAGKEQNACSIIGYEQEISHPTEMYIVTQNYSREYLRKWLVSLGYQYDTQVYDTVYMEKYGLNYTGEYLVELNNTLLDALNGASTEKGMVIAKRLTMILPLCVFIIAILMLTSTISIEMEMTRKENGLLRLCGFSPGLFIIYQVCKGLLLYVPACVTALVFSKFCCQWIVWLAQQARVSELNRLQISFQWEQAFLAMGVMFLATVFGTLFPILLSLRENVVDMLKGAVRCPSNERKNFSAKELKIKGFYEWKIAGNMLFSHKFRTLSVIVSIMLMSCMALTYIICFQVMQQRLKEQKESYRSEFSLLGDNSVDAYALLKQIPNISWSNVMYDSITEYEVGNVEMNSLFDEKDYEYWRDGEKMRIETCSMSEWFYETYIEEGDSTLPSYAELEENKEGVLCDRGNVVRNGKKISGNVFSETPPEVLKIKNGDNISIAGRGIVKDSSDSDGDTMPMLFVPDKVYLEKYTPFYTIIYLNADTGKEQKVREWFVEHKDDLNVTVGDYATEYLESRDTTGMLGKILLGALVIIGGIGTANIVNTFMMDAQVQKKEYAILRALGMGRLNLFMIIFGECFGYVAAGLVGSVLYIYLLLQWILEKMVNIQLVGYAYCLVLLLKLSAYMLVFALVIGVVSLYAQIKKGLTDVLRYE